MNLVRDIKLKELGIQVCTESEVMFRFIEQHLFNNKPYRYKNSSNVYYLKGKMINFYISPSIIIYVKESIYNIIKQYTNQEDREEGLKILLKKHYDFDNIKSVHVWDDELVNDFKDIVESNNSNFLIEL